MEEFDFTKEYGVVLEGGGAKGAYQIGVWRAMCECGVKIKGISGVSVGALNGALMCMGDLDLAEKLWGSISYSKVMDVDDEQMSNLINLNFRELHVAQITKTGMKLLASRGFNINPLKKLIEECIDEEKIRLAAQEFIFGTFSVRERKEIEIIASEAEEGSIADYLMASAYFPAFRNEKLLGQTFMDGGMFNNVPIDMLLKRGYQHIIVIRIFGIGLERRVKIPEDVKIVEIAPRVSLGNMLDFDHNKSKRNMKIGYYDGLRCFKSLSGFIYYIDSQFSELECMKRLMLCDQAVKMALLEYFDEDYSDCERYHRKMFEIVWPNVASELKLPKNWTYKELYLATLELCAKHLRIQKYKVYTEEELITEIKRNYLNQKKRRSGLIFPLFIELIIKFVTI